jgi:predicted DNA-binding WGR domain protein
MKKYFVFKDNISNKFWKINLKKNQMIITFGRIGIKNPVSQLRKFDSNEEAKKYAERKIREKTNKGYIEKNEK